MNLASNSAATAKDYIRYVTALLLLGSMLSGCASFSNSEAIASGTEMTAEAASGSDTEQPDSTKSAELVQAEQQVKALEQQLESLKIEWEQQKPALERLVNNEADLEFLVQALADMSQLSDEPSRSQYLGQEDLSPEKKEQSLQALQSLVTTQEELNTLLVELSSVVSEVAATRQDTESQSVAASSPVHEAPTVPEAQSEDMFDSNLAHQNSTPNTAPRYAAVSAQPIHAVPLASQADCDCSSAESTSDTTAKPAGSRDPAWFAMTTPYVEATPADSANQSSQLDGAAASGKPIPGLQVKTFKRRTLPSELSAAGADMQHYAMAPQFHMSRKSLTDYVSQLAFKLAGNQQLAGNKIGVASFVFFDEQLEQTSAVGNQLAEELSTVLPNYGAKVIEYKLTREITVSPSGDLSLSRNTKKLRDSQGMDYVLTGTMVPTRRGLQINSRVVSTRDNVVIASASTLIPAMVLQQL